MAIPKEIFMVIAKFLVMTKIIFTIIITFLYTHYAKLVLDR